MHFCATCDGAFYRGQEVLVIGGGNSAGEEGVFLTRFADRVTIATKDPQLTASKVVVEKVAENPKIDLLTNVRPVELRGQNRLESVVLENTVSGERRELRPGGVFVFVGLTPNTAFLRDLIKLDERGFILTDGTLATNVPGIFAAGDSRAGSTKQAASAAGEGAAVALAIRRYVEALADGAPEHAVRPAEMTVA